MNLSAIIENKNGDPYFKCIAIFLDKTGSVQIVKIREVPNVVLEINSFNESGQMTGYINIFFHPNNRFYLDAIYCYDQFRGRNIATYLSEIADHVLRDYSGYIIRGVYNPKQLSTDRVNNIYCSQLELDERATAFYKITGYQKIYYNDYISDPTQYPDIDLVNDFQLSEKIPNCIVAKRLMQEKDYHFNEINGLLIHKNALDFYQNVIAPYSIENGKLF